MSDLANRRDKLPSVPTKTEDMPPLEPTTDHPIDTEDVSSARPERKRWITVTAATVAGSLAVAGAAILGPKVFGGDNAPKSTPEPIPSASAPLTPGPEASATATKTPETQTPADEMVGNINVANLSPAARAYAARLTPNLVNDMTPDQFREAIRITPDTAATDDPTILAELASVRSAILNSAGQTPEVLAKALAAGERFDQYVLQNYWIPGFEADSGIGATPDEQEVSRFRDQANRYDVLASIGPEYAPVAKYTLTNVEISPDTDFQATVTMTFKEQQSQIPDSLAMEYRIRPTIAAPVNLSDTHTYSFNLTTVDGKQVWNIEQVQG